MIHFIMYMFEMRYDLVVLINIKISLSPSLQLLNNRWNSSSREVAGLRMALSNEEEFQQFRQFIKNQGEMMENNLNFWLEIQKYKVP